MIATGDMYTLLPAGTRGALTVTTALLLRGPSGVVLDLARRRVAVRGFPIRLQRREFDLLRILLERQGHVVSFDEVARATWGVHADGDARFLYTAVWRLRRALAAAGADGVIRSVRGVGYVMAGATDTDSDSDPSVSGARRRADPALAVINPYLPQRPFLLVNDAAVALSGYSADTLTSATFDTDLLWAPTERPHLERALERASVQGSAESRRRRLRQAGGGIVIVTLTLTRLDGGNGGSLMVMDFQPLGGVGGARSARSARSS